jgi:hypothetical protein
MLNDREERAEQAAKNQPTRSSIVPFNPDEDVRNHNSGR